jgi:hypothetical protein
MKEKANRKDGIAPYYRKQKMGQKRFLGNGKTGVLQANCNETASKQHIKRLRKYRCFLFFGFFFPFTCKQIQAQ